MLQTFPMLFRSLFTALAMTAALASNAQLSYSPVAVLPAEKSIVLPGRIQMNYVESGNPKSMPVIFLHGFSDSWHSFEPILPLMPDNLHIIAVSQRGHGNSDKPKENYRPEDFADDLAAFMDALSLKPALIVGHSLGTCVAQAFAVKYPKKTIGLVLEGGFANAKNIDAIDELSKVINELTDPVDTGFIRGFQAGSVHRPVPDEFFQTVLAESSKLPHYVWKEIVKNLTEFDYTNQLHKYLKPVLISWGDLDPIATKDQQAILKSLLRGAKLLVYPGTGHTVHWEEPAAFAADLLSFISSIQE